jgi:hypothetical protein
MQVIADIHPDTPLDRALYYREHLRTYAGFRHLIGWFAAHVLVDLAAIAAFVAGDPWLGFVCLVGAVAVLAWGIVSTRAAVSRALGEDPAPAGTRPGGLPANLEPSQLPADQ